MVCLAIHLHLAGRTLDADARLEHLDHLVAVQRTGLLHRFGPQLDALVLRHRDLVHDLGVAEPLAPAREEILVGRRRVFLAVVAGDQDAVAFGRRQRQVLVADTEGGREQRDLLVHARGRPLPEERQVRAADQRRAHRIGLGLLDLGDRRAEVRHVEREEAGLRDGAAALLDVVRDPLGGDLAVVVVGGQHVDLLAPLLDRDLDDRLHRLRRRRARHEAVAVAHAAFVQHVVEVQQVGAAEGLANRLARRRRDAAVHDVDLVVACQLLRVLGVQRDVGLGVVLHHLDLAAEQPASGVDLLGRHLRGLHHRLAVGVEVARVVEHRAELDRPALRKGTTQRQRAAGCDAGRRSDEVAT